MSDDMSRVTVIPAILGDDVEPEAIDLWLNYAPSGVEIIRPTDPRFFDCVVQFTQTLMDAVTPPAVREVMEEAAHELAERLPYVDNDDGALN